MCSLQDEVKKTKEKLIYITLDYYNILIKTY